ncbi:hypothetical protein [Mycobacterium sp. OTB74]|uniref:hypothetical protein n=1 Tax=Mycobacterium sp. OTB74 TaxID=1853452 RepID=UPI002476DA2D|nr:hypothetical protein [Mycobacterium sp. OTB74]
MTSPRTLRGVELVKVGTWPAHTTDGADWVVTADDLAAAVAAHQAGVLRKPVIKLGHNDSRNDGDPALGFVDNLQLTDDGNTLVGDLCNMPAQLAEVLPHAYPDRSVEALINYVDKDGTCWPLVLTACGLLGTESPAVSTLQSLAELYGVAASRRVAATIRIGQPPTDTMTVIRAAARRTRHRNRNTSRKATTQ